jgi:hypothetical protein
MMRGKRVRPSCELCSSSLCLLLCYSHCNYRFPLCFAILCIKPRTFLYVIVILICYVFFFVYYSTNKVVEYIELCQKYSSRGFYTLILCHLAIYIYIHRKKDHSSLHVFVYERERTTIKSIQQLKDMMCFISKKIKERA